jgi:hypothetical protein
MRYSEFDSFDTESGPYGAVIPAGGLPPEYAEAYRETADTEPEPSGGGLPADVLASLELPTNAEPGQQAAAEPVVPAHDLIEGFRMELPRGGWVKFGSILDVSGGLRKQIITQIGVLTQRVQSGKATAYEQVAVDNEVTTKLLNAIVEAWSYDVPIPILRDGLDKLPGLVVDRVSAVAAEYMKMLIEKAGGNQGSETDPSSPQRPSAG